MILQRNAHHKIVFMRAVSRACRAVRGGEKSDRPHEVSEYDRAAHSTQNGRFGGVAVLRTPQHPRRRVDFARAQTQAKVTRGLLPCGPKLRSRRECAVRARLTVQEHAVRLRVVCRLFTPCPSSKPRSAKAREQSLCIPREPREARWQHRDSNRHARAELLTWRARNWRFRWVR